jgi:hypothetical protein
MANADFAMKAGAVADRVTIEPKVVDRLLVRFGDTAW